MDRSLSSSLPEVCRSFDNQLRVGDIYILLQQGVYGN